MIKYRQEPYEEYFRVKDKEWYSAPQELSPQLLGIYRIYFKWLIDLYITNEVARLGVPMKRGISFLEVGCRMGEAYVVLNELYSGRVKFIGMELSRRVIELSKTYHNSISFGDICDCDWEMDCFDIVFCRTLLGFLRDIPLAIKGMLNLLKVGGWLVIIQPFPYPIGLYHYNSVDSIKDILPFFGNNIRTYFESIPVKGEDGRSVFGEPILIVEKGSVRE